MPLVGVGAQTGLHLVDEGHQVCDALGVGAALVEVKHVEVSFLSSAGSSCSTEAIRTLVPATRLALTSCARR